VRVTTEPEGGQVTVRLPAVLAELAGGERLLHVAPVPATVAALFDALATSHPALERRIRDESGALRRFVNVYVGESDVRGTGGQATALARGDEVWVLPSVAGG
jgi:molybdopterin converting factor small subunit